MSLLPYLRPDGVLEVSRDPAAPDPWTNPELVYPGDPRHAELLELLRQVGAARAGCLRDENGRPLPSGPSFL
jgi:hypothetical protein